MKKHHILTIDSPCQLAEEGFVIGNGDLSASCFQKPGKIIFQFGKNDFWDLRQDMSQNPRPAHIDELIFAIKNGVQVDGVTNKVTCSKTAPHSRLQEITRPMPSQQRNAPMPKPAAMLYIHYPADWQECKWQQLLDVESGTLTVKCAHFDGVQLIITAFIHPDRNVFNLKWQLLNHSPEKLYGGNFFGLPEVPPVHATLFREDEPSAEQWAKSELLEHGNYYFSCPSPFPTLPPAVIKDGVLVQQIPDSGNLYAALDGDAKIIRKNNFLRLLPEADVSEGFLSIGISTVSADDAKELSINRHWDKDINDTRLAAEEFWKKSSVAFEDDILENSWYAAMHTKRSILRAGTPPPGLFIPSTLQPFSLWKGDYHLNYNFQSLFLGDYESNHTDTGDAYFDGIKYLMALGEKIARDYYNIDGGCFIQLCGYPRYSEDDYMGYLPLGRMAYMTGWVAAYFFRRWKLTMDTTFLREQAYPALKKFATFYAGFLQADPRGVYHAFPSNQGEDVFSEEGATDKPQVLMHARFALTAAAKAAQELDTDHQKSAVWLHIAAHLPVTEFSDYPEFYAFDGQIDPPDSLPDFLTAGNRFHDWYMGQMPYKFSIRLHRNIWRKEVWHEKLLTFIKRWRLPNGLLRAMSACTHGYRGGWTESLGIAGALTDMLMTGSADGFIRLFPGIPENKSAKFSTLRAPGAFLVSAEKKGRMITQFSLLAEKGGVCKIHAPWPETLWVEKNIIMHQDILEIAAEIGETATFRPARSIQNQ